MEESITRNVYADGATAGCGQAVAYYVLAAKEALATLPVETIKRGGLKFR